MELMNNHQDILSGDLSHAQRAELEAYKDQIMFLVNDAHISLDRLWALPEAERVDVYRHADQVDWLEWGGIPLERLIKLKAEERSELYAHVDEVIALVNHGMLSVEVLWEVSDADRFTLYRQADAVSALVLRAHLSLEKLGGLELAQRLAICSHAHEILALIEGTRLSWDSLMALTAEERSELYAHRDPVIRLIKSGVDLRQLFDLSKEERLELYAYAAPVARIIDGCGLLAETFLRLGRRVRVGLCASSMDGEAADAMRRLLSEQALSLSPEERLELSEHAGAVLCLVRDAYLSFTQLRQLKLEERMALYHHSTSFVVLIQKLDRQLNPSMGRFLGLSEALRLGLYAHADAVLLLIEVAGISWNVLLDFPESFRVELYHHAEAMLSVMRQLEIPFEKCENSHLRFFLPDRLLSCIWSTKISVEDFLMLSEGQQLELYRYADQVSVLLNRCKMSLADLFAFPEAFRSKLYLHGWELARRLGAQNYDGLIQRGLLDQRSLLEELLHVEDAQCIQGITDKVMRRLRALRILPANGTLEVPDMDAMISVAQGLLEIRKNAIVLNQARPPTGLGCLPEMLQRQMLQWTGHDQKDEFEAASYIDQEVKRQFPRRF